MTPIQILYTMLIKPLELLYEYIFAVAQKGMPNPALSIVILSLTVNLLVLPLYKRADEVQEAERAMENKLRDGVAHIKKSFRGDERMMILQTYYRQNHYRPTDVFKGSVSLFLEIPFFIAAYRFLSTLSLLNGTSFGIISDLGAPDALLHFGALSINVLPIIMTSVNLISCVIFTKGYPLKTKIQLYGMALFFLVFLYKSPSGLVLYWTLNNIFSLVKTLYYKYELSKKILNILFAITGAVLLVSTPVLRSKITGSKSFLLIILLLSIICFVPLFLSLIKSKVNKKPDKILKILPEGGYPIFLALGLYFTLLLGVLIPSGVIASSPQEFVDLYNYSSPLWFVLSSLCIAIGVFVLWFGVFYALANVHVRRLFCLLMWVGSILATVNYIFFGKNRAVLNSSLGFTEEFTIPITEKLINIALLLILGILLIIVFKFLAKPAWIGIVGCIALIIMSGINIAKIDKGTKDLKVQAQKAVEDMPTISLSRNGNNVVVIMLDKASGVFIPYFLNEKPEIKDMYSGFTFYPNTISFGAYTNFGSPGIFGGYEYTPESMNMRDDVSLMDKQNEALKLMPVIFGENGYEVTVCDAPYADYNWVFDPSFFEEYSYVNAYNTKGYFWAAHKEGVSNRNYRNFFCYSLMKAAPLFVQNHLYDGGFYNENMITNDFSDEITNGNGQYIKSMYTAQGIYDEFMWDYSTLLNLETMTDISDDDTKHYFTIDNDTTHDPIMLQEPEYDVKYDVDNTAYERDHSDRFTVDGMTINMDNSEKYVFYQCNMSSILALGRWFEYLKKEGVYDNTRIIIVSDHGRALHLNDAYHLDDGTDEFMDIEAYYPLLMIKDFNSKEFSVSEEFMTNADVPTYAMKDLIDNPINPFTGNPVNNDEKFSHPQYVLGSPKWVVDGNNGNTFLPGLWLSVEKDMRDKNNWTVIKDER